MEIKLNQKIIKERCGTVSFKKGEAFYRAGKVRFEQDKETRIEAIVSGTEEFAVTVDKEENGAFEASCSCPKLASVKNDCQHIAAVLLAIQQQRVVEDTLEPGSQDTRESGLNELASGLFSIFNGQPHMPSGSQQYFETREMLKAEFIIRPVDSDHGETFLGISIKVASLMIENISVFLSAVQKGREIPLSPDFIYDSRRFCFDTNTALVLAKLGDLLGGQQWPISEADTFIIPPAAWEQLLPMLKETKVYLQHDGQVYEGLAESKERLPLEFNFEETEHRSFFLSIAGMDRVSILKPYHSVIHKGEFVKLLPEDSVRLFELRKLLLAAKNNHILIEEKQMGAFIEKVVPGLRRLGQVKLAGDAARKFIKTPLEAKLYLDRVNNRLLAGLEFHYGSISWNPLEGRELPASSQLIRDTDKEELILEMMEESSFARTEGGYFLHNEELEYDFLHHMMPKLEKFVQVFATTAVRNRIFRAPAPPQIRVKVKKERTNWLEFEFKIDGIPEQQIRDLLEAIEEKRKYIRLRSGSLLSLETREFEEIQRFLKAGPIQAEDLERGLNVPLVSGLRLMEMSEDQGIFVQEESFREFLDEISKPGIGDHEVPASLENILRDYQTQGFQWMKTLASYGFGGILADDMGLGKTLQSIAFILSELSEIRQATQPVLIICPSSLTYNWLGEFMKFAPEIRAAIADGPKTERIAILHAKNEWDVIISSYPLLRQDIQLYEKSTFHTVFFDEAQAFKNPLTQTAKAVGKLRAPNRFALTGTPIENSAEELWSIFRVVFPELFQGLKEFSKLPSKSISRRIRPFMLRRLKEDVLEELPGKIESIDTSELYPEQKKLYAAYLAKLRHKTLKHLDKDTLRKNRIKILAGLTRLRQICCHPALFVDGYNGGSAKFEQLLQIVEESKQAGRRVLIFSQFTKMLSLIGRELAMQGIPFFYLDGQTPSEERVDTCNRFNEGERNFFLISLKAGGTGLNLAGADTVILYDLWWNPAVEEQAADRAHRMGQKNKVQVIKLIARGTIEEKMNELQEKKRSLVEEIVEGRNAPGLTEEDIREILMI